MEQEIPHLIPEEGGIARAERLVHLEDLLDHCNLKCPTCFAESSPARASVAPLEQVLASIDTRLSRERQRIDVLMLSGGEPTLYPWLAELLDEVTARPIVRVRFFGRRSRSTFVGAATRVFIPE